MKLPNPENAIVDRQKLAGYCLNPNHPDGKHKARVFKSALSLVMNNADELSLALIEAAKNNGAIPATRNQYGQKYIIDFSLTRNNSTAIIHSIWIIKNQENFPRLVTCYVL